MVSTTVFRYGAQAQGPSRHRSGPETAAKSQGTAKVQVPPTEDGAWCLVGMDVHKEHCQLCIETELGVILQRRDKTCRSTLEAVLGGRPPMKVLER